MSNAERLRQVRETAAQVLALIDQAGIEPVHEQPLLLDLLAQDLERYATRLRDQARALMLYSR